MYSLTVKKYYMCIIESLKKRFSAGPQGGNQSVIDLIKSAVDDGKMVLEEAHDNVYAIISAVSTV